MFDEESPLTATLALQTAFPGLCPVTEAVEKLATEGGIEERGAIYTKREVVDFILDLTGYTVNAPLTDYHLLEPSFGDGDFLLPIIDRLLARAANDDKLTYDDLAPAIRAVEMHRSTFGSTRALVEQRLRESAIGYPRTIRVDNGSEFISRDLDLWAYARQVTLDFSRPGKPTDNGFIEAFNSKLRAECLNAHWFMSLADATEKLEDWRRHYNDDRPHSAIGYNVSSALHFPDGVTSPPS